MATTKQQQARGNKHSSGTNRNSKQGVSKTFYLIPAGIILLTFIVYSSIFSADFVNWDDPTFVLGNKNITGLSFEHIKNMFTTYCMGNYCPLTIFSYAIDYQLSGGLGPKMFHFTSLFIHLVNTFLVYLFVYLLCNSEGVRSPSDKQLMVAAIASLLFAIHPMHIESVAWIAERRDVLYAMFYLLGLIAYMRYLNNNYKIKYLIFALLFFLGSLFSKGQAVTFPVVLLIIDYINKRKFDTKLVMEKIPFFILSLVFGYIAVIAQKTTPSLNVMHFSFFDSLFVGNYGLLLYLIKSIIPFKLTGYHPYPFTNASDIPLIIRLAPVFIIAVIAIVFIKFKSNRVVVGGLLFFLATILPVLQFLPVGETIISERYTYIPYVGLFFIVGYIGNEAGKLRSYLRPALVILIVLFTVITFNRVGVWKNSIAFWTDVIEHYPDNKIPYNNRGYMYNEFDQFNLAIADFNKGISIDSAYGRLYLNRGLSYARQKMYDLAMADYTKSIELDTTEPQTYMNRGGIYTDVLNKYDSGISDFKHVIKMRPDYTEAMDNLGVSYFKNGEYDNAITWYSKSIALKPDDSKIYYFRALVYAAKKDYDKALADAAKSQELGFTVDGALIQQWKAFAGAAPAKY